MTVRAGGPMVHLQSSVSGPHQRFLLSPGVVGLWDLTSKSMLLRVREADRSLTLLPYQCILAHDHAVRALAFCPASR